MSPLSDKQRQRIITRHRQSIERHGYTPSALFWSSREIQQIRFEILLGVMGCGAAVVPRPTVLDVGCGFADLSHFLAYSGIEAHYHGIDLSPDMVKSARYQSPGLQVGPGDIFDLDPTPQSYDYVLLSGALNEVVDEPPAEAGDYARATIRKMYESCRCGVAFNLLDARDEWTANRPDLQSFKPGEILEYCQKFADVVKPVDGYLDNDFTVYLLRSDCMGGSGV